MNRLDLGKTTFLVVLKLDKVTLPYLSKLVSYLLGSGFGLDKLGFRKESIGLFPINTACGVLENFVIELLFGLY